MWVIVTMTKGGNENDMENEKDRARSDKYHLWHIEYCVPIRNTNVV
jgi:hypothetical protein